MTDIKPWLSQLTRSFVRRNGLVPSELDKPEIRVYRSSGPANEEKKTKNMEATFLMLGREGNHHGSCLINYETVHLETLFKNNLVPDVYGYNPKTTREVAELLVAQYGLSLEPAWFINRPFDATILPTHVTLETIENDFCAPSTLTVQIVRSESDVAELFLNTVLDEPTLPFDPLMHSCPMTTYNKDFTPFYEDQKAWFTESVVSTVAYQGGVSQAANAVGRLELCQYIASILGTDATINVSDTAGTNSLNQINLALFYVRYNGKTANAIYKNVSANTDYDNVLILEQHFTPDKTNYDGPLFIHYNNA